MTLFATAVEAWFTNETSNLAFGLSGGLMGTLGGLFGILGIRRIPRNVGMKILISLFVLCGCSAMVGLFALLGGNQPYHVWYPFLTFGVVGMFAIGLTGFTWKRAYRELDQRQLDSKLLREEWPKEGQC